MNHVSKNKKIQDISILKGHCQDLLASMQRIIFIGTPFTGEDDDALTHTKQEADIACPSIMPVHKFDVKNEYQMI
ncbi:unnamed protein product [Trifolium pratense]|uniref:Uncharacterized protein n=1 Tax=Trifolium pratense TaxID=57577 RepID=A0ACB0LLQ3_TRIPR|nr:unnamed protein product [Trifolium pratense]